MSSDARLAKLREFMDEAMRCSSALCFVEAWFA